MLVNRASKTEAIELLKQLIALPSFSKEEDKTAALLSAFFAKKGLKPERKGNNIWVKSKYHKPKLPTLLLNSHHDTVKPVSGWQSNPFKPALNAGQLRGLGSNDAGASLVSLAAVFLHNYKRKDLPFNLVFLASAEEEISGPGGVASVLSDLGKIDFGIVGEPTQMQPAIAEKGLMVIDGIATGKAGHAARAEGINALYLALEDINKLRQFSFDKTSQHLGAIKVSVTQIEAGTQHNVVPDRCKFVIDVRSTDAYSNREVFELLQSATQSELVARSFRLNSSGVPEEHPLVRAANSLNMQTFGSSTLSDQALMPFPTIKMGPGKSERSHTAEEFIEIQEIENGIETYQEFLEALSEIFFDDNSIEQV